MSQIPIIFSPFKNVIALQTTKISSVELQLEKFGISEKSLATAKQIHDNKIFLAERPMHAEGFDAIISNEKNVFVSVKTADCVPVLIYDAETNSVAAIHAGWKGTVLKIVSETLARMKKEFGTEGKNCYAYIGTCISECSFEVGEEVAEKFEAEFCRSSSAKASADNARDAQRVDKYFVDLKKANKKQLADFGIPDSQIEISDYCTVLNNDLHFSYRKENGAPGRMLSVIGVTF